MKFKLYIVAYTANEYKEAIKPYINILNKYNFSESESHELGEESNKWIYECYDFNIKYAGTIEINDLIRLVSFRNELPIDFIVSEQNSIILCNDRID